MKNNMIDEYEKVLEQMKIDMAEDIGVCNGVFDIQDGELGYVIGWKGGIPDMQKLQQYVNEKLGQRRYTAICGVTREVYARNMDEAREFLERAKPKGTSVRDIQEHW